MPMVTHPVQTSSGLDTTSRIVKKSNLNVTLSQGTTTETGASSSQITDTSQLMTSVTISSNQTAISNLAYTTQKTIDPKSPTTDTMSGTSTSQVYVVFRFIKGMLTLFISCENKIVLPFTHIYSFSPKCWKKNSGSFFYSILNKEWSLWFLRIEHRMDIHASTMVTFCIRLRCRFRKIQTSEDRPLLKSLILYSPICYWFISPARWNIYRKKP